MAYFTHAFETQIERLEIGTAKTVSYRVVFLPPEIESDLPFDQFSRLRVEGEIADVPVRGAWIPVGDGRRYFIVSPAVRKQTGLDVGDRAEMRLPVDDQDYVDVPMALELAVNVRDELKQAWTSLTPGKQRMFSAHVRSAKTEMTEARRVAEAVEAIGLGLTIRDLKGLRKAKIK